VLATRCTAAAGTSLEKATIRKVTRRLIPFLALLMILNFLDRTNVGFAALRMERDVGIGAADYGFGAGIFFIGYFLFEVPSNLALHRFGARRWLARIMISWGIVAMLMAGIRTTPQFVGLRVLLGVAEAGFYPGVIYFISLWFPARHRAGVIALFYLGVPIAQVIGAPVSAALIELGDGMGLDGWRVMYLVEGLPAVVLGIVALFFLTDRPADAEWLSAEERSWLMTELEAEQLRIQEPASSVGFRLRHALVNRHVVALALIYFGITLGSNAMNFFLPSILQTFATGSGGRRGLMATGMLTAIPYAIAAVSMVLWSRSADRSNERRFHVGGAAMLAAVSIVLAFLINGPVAVLVGFTAMASGIYAAINVFWSVPPRFLSGIGAAAGIGAINSIGNLSGFAGPYLIGSIYQATGSYKPAFFMIAALVFLSGAAFVILMRGEDRGASGSVDGRPT
jgi:ACS family tartrate transporter-like MFS transporter